MITRDSKRIRKGELDNLLDGMGKTWGVLCFASFAALFWLPS